MIEADRAREWLIQQLRNNPELRTLLPEDVCGGVYDGLIPADAELPAIVVSEASGGDLMEAGSERVLVTASFLVSCVVCGESYGPARPIADRIDQLLHNHSGEIDGVLILACTREHSFSQDEVTDGEHYRHLGGYYQTLVQAKE